MKGIAHSLSYAAWLAKEIFAAGLTAVVAAFRRNSGIAPIVIFYPLRVTTEWEMFWFSTSITATPGTLSMGFRYDPDREGGKFLLVQAVFGEDPMSQIEGLIEMEQRLAPRVATQPLDPADVGWRPYVDTVSERQD
ncbi:sodium:proton antiporter [Corynebacterium liangguodongii]|uniref:Sodium:proton antiporter n=2 Tax=Corynebacterium liangguodongii TaxID=2079535 RepID=A0A2S0WBQ7_9CORY|nr:sodium:proton antiporter [Corynebacterium liangguodongii]PWB98804.1 sodium:proton antiporter [Corynebacterium liangguodongii]